MIFYLLSVLATKKSDDTASVQAGIQKLHEKTEFATFYDLFEITSNANLQQIQRIYKKMLKEKRVLPGLNLDQSEQFFTEAYNVLSKNRYTYDYLLKYQCFPGEAYKWYYWVIVLFIIGITLDFLSMIYRYKRLQAMDKKERKKIERKGKSVRGIMVSELYSVKALMRVKNMIFG